MHRHCDIKDCLDLVELIVHSYGRVFLSCSFIILNTLICLCLLLQRAIFVHVGTFHTGERVIIHCYLFHYRSVVARLSMSMFALVFGQSTFYIEMAEESLLWSKGK